MIFFYFKPRSNMVLRQNYDDFNELIVLQELLDRMNDHGLVSKGNELLRCFTPHSQAFATCDDDGVLLH